MLKKTAIYSLLFSTILVLIIFLLSFSHARHNKRLIKKLNITIEEANKYRFANEKNIRNFIYELEGEIEKKNINGIHLSLIEKRLKQFDFIKDVQIYMGIDGQLYLHIWQKKPLARIKIASKDYYITQESLMNICPWYSENVILVEGLFLETEIEVLKKMIQYINDDELLKNQIIGIKKTLSKKINLLPKEANYIIELGNLSNYKDKLERFKTFYKQYMILLEIEKYKKIDLQYAKQVVATKA